MRFKLYYIITLLLFSISALATHQHLIISAADSSLSTTDGQAARNEVDIMSEALRRLNIPFKVVLSPWERAQSMIKKGEADMFMTVPTAARLSYATATKKPSWKKYTYMFARKDNPSMSLIRKVTRIEDIDNHTLSVIILRGNGWADENIVPFVKTIYYAKNVLHSFKMLFRRRGDIVFDSEVAGRDRLKSIGATDSVEMLPQRMGEQHHHIMIGKESPFAHLMPKIEETILKMHHDGTMTKIMARYGQSYP